MMSCMRTNRSPLHGVRAAREKSGRSLRDVAEEIGLPFTHLGEAERGERSLPKKHWAALAEAIGVTTSFVALCCIGAGPVTIDLREADPSTRELLAKFIAERCST